MLPAINAFVVLWRGLFRLWYQQASELDSISPSHQRCRRHVDLTARSARTIRRRHGVSGPFTRIFEPPMETPAACHVRVGAATLKPCENVAEYRIRLFLPYILRSTPLLGATREKARRMPKRFTKSGRCRAGSHLRSLVDTTCFVQFARR
jgi:hypothetical protein